MGVIVWVSLGMYARPLMMLFLVGGTHRSRQPYSLLPTPYTAYGQFSKFGSLLGLFYQGAALFWGPKMGPYYRELRILLMI